MRQPKRRSPYRGTRIDDARTLWAAYLSRTRASGWSKVARASGGGTRRRIWHVPIMASHFCIEVADVDGVYVWLRTARISVHNALLNCFDKVKAKRSQSGRCV